jgi:3-oxoacyl-[acyl-carrier protein] reductase
MAGARGRLPRAHDRHDPVKLASKVAVVTGAGRGIGAAIAHAFAVEGATVVAVDRDRSAVEATAAAIASRGGSVTSLVVDVTDANAVHEAANEARKIAGDVQILVNNAAIDATNLVVEMPIDEWNRIIAGNLTSVFLCTRAFLPPMIESRWGRIINMGSQHALTGADRVAHYCAAKAGVHGFTRALALEVARFHITVNTIAPGPIDTEMLRAMPADWLESRRRSIPLQRFGSADEIAPTAVLLASDDGAFFTGSTLNVSGGDALL